MPAEPRRVSQGRAPYPSGRAGHGSHSGHGPRSSRSNQTIRPAAGRPAGIGQPRLRSLIDAPRGTAASCVVLGPFVGALVGDVIGGYSGPLFALASVLAATVAVAAATPSGQWWVLPAVAPTIWVVSMLAELVLGSAQSQDGKAQAAAVAHATIHAFPVMVAATIAAVATVVAGRIVVVRRGVTHV